MAFHDVQFPTEVRIEMTGGHGFKTTIPATPSGYEQRNIDWSISRGEWQVSLIRTQAQLTTLKNFFMARYGRAHSFRFKDWSDFRATDESLGVGDGSDDTWQIIKTYSSGGYSYVRDINKPVSGSLSVKVAGTTKTETTQYTVDYATGIITFTAGNIPTNGQAITASYQFDCHCRFDTDRFDIKIIYPDTGNNDLIAEWPSGQIIELKDVS